MPNTGKSRRDAILDTAEELFADRGFDGVSMRMVAQRADVGLGLVTYHFATKDILFEETFGRRAQALNKARSAVLATLSGASLETLIGGFFAPYRDFIAHGDPGWRAYARLHATLTQDARWTDFVSGHFGDVAHEMIRRMGEAEPGLDEVAAVRGYVLMIGAAVSVFSDTRLLDRLSNGTASSYDVGAALESLVRFTAAGIRSLRTSDPQGFIKSDVPDAMGG